MNRILFCATVDYHFKVFHLHYLKFFQENGWEVHVAAYGDMDLPYVDKKYNLPIQRSPFKQENWRAYRELKAIIEKNDYTMIHCHTPMGGVLARLAARNARRRGTRVLYTAHGFHFCKGAPLLNWIVYYPIERWLAHYTDCLITINEEDYNRAVKDGFKAPRIEHVHGVGVDTERFHPVSEEEKLELRRKYGFQPDEFLMFYAAEFNRNKNQEFLIRALAEVKEEVPKARLLLAGDGALLGYCRDLARELKIEQMVCFLGYRSDLEELTPMCDIVVASSLREGLPVNIMEAMACGLPVLAVDNRGHRELVRSGINGFIVSPEDTPNFTKNLHELYTSAYLRTQMSHKAIESVEKYSIKHTGPELNNIYISLFKETFGCGLELA